MIKIRAGDIGSGGSRKFCRGGPNICWPLAVAGRLVIEDNSGSRLAQ